MTDIDAARPPLPTISRLTALFQRGEVVELGEDESGPVLLWMNALTATEREEAVLDGAVAQALERTLNGPGSTTYEAMRAELEGATRDQVVDGLCLSRATEAWANAQDDLHADEKWRGDKLLLIERGDAALQSGMPMTAEEQGALAELNNEYTADWKVYATKRVEAMRAEYQTQETRELVAAYLKSWSDSRALKVQADEYRISQLFFGTRNCRATKLEDDSFDHSRCEDHMQLVFPDRRAVRMSADALVALLIPVADRIDRLGGDALGKR